MAISLLLGSFFGFLNEQRWKALSGLFDQYRGGVLVYCLKAKELMLQRVRSLSIFCSLSIRPGFVFGLKLFFDGMACTAYFFSPFGLINCIQRGEQYGRFNDGLVL